MLLEAMALALPVVTTTVSGGPEIVTHEATGLLCDPGDPGVLADALERLLGDPEGAVRMGEAGRARAEQLFDLQKNVASLHALFERAAGRSQAAARVMS